MPVLAPPDCLAGDRGGGNGDHLAMIMVQPANQPTMWQANWQGLRAARTLIEALHDGLERTRNGTELLPDLIIDLIVREAIAGCS